MSSISQFTGGGGGGLTPKFQEFNSSGTFTPSQALIDAGGYIEVFLVGGGGNNGSGGETIIKKMYLTSTSGISVVIGAGATAYTQASGADSSFSGTSAGGVDILAKGGIGGSTGSGFQINRLGSGWRQSSNNAAGSGVFGYGGGGTGGSNGGVYEGQVNSGQGSNYNEKAGSGYCLITWYE